MNENVSHDQDHMGHVAVTFEPLEFRKRSAKEGLVLNEAGQLLYYVHDRSGEIKEVMATSALEAIEQSGVAAPAKVIRADSVHTGVLDEEVMQEDEEKAELYVRAKTILKPAEALEALKAGKQAAAEENEAEAAAEPKENVEEAEKSATNPEADEPTDEAQVEAAPSSEQAEPGEASGEDSEAGATPEGEEDTPDA